MAPLGPKQEPWILLSSGIMSFFLSVALLCGSRLPYRITIWILSIVIEQ